MGNTADQFKERIVEYLAVSEENTVYSTDLKTMIHLADTEQELQTTIDLFKRFCRQEFADLRSDFQYGPIIMRLCHYLQQPNIALEIAMNEDYSRKFLQQSSMLILLDMLYENGMYKAVFDVYDTVGKDILVYPNSKTVTSDAQMLLGATAWKMNTQEALQKMNDMFQEFRKNEINSRFACYLCMLALNQGKGDIALELLGQLELRKTKLLLNTKVLVFAQMGKIDEALTALKEQYFRQGIQNSSVWKFAFTVCQPVVEELRKSAEKTQNEQMIKECNTLIEELNNNNWISNEDLDDLLNAVIFPPKSPQDGYSKRQQLKKDKYPLPVIGRTIPTVP